MSGTDQAIMTIIAFLQLSIGVSIFALLVIGVTSGAKGIKDFWKK